MALLAVVLAGCTGATTPSTSGGAAKLDKVTLALDWTPNTNHTGIYVAMQKGWYRQQGIDLSLLPYSSSVAPETLVATGKADFGISFTEGVTAARAAVQPLVSVAAGVQHQTSAAVSLHSSRAGNVAKAAGQRLPGLRAPP